MRSGNLVSLASPVILSNNYLTLTRFVFLHKSIRTMPAPLLTTVSTPQKISCSEHHQPIFKVIILTLPKHFSFVTRFHHLKHERRTGPARSPRRAKATLEIFPIEKIVNISEEPQLPSIVTQR